MRLFRKKKKHPFPWAEEGSDESLQKRQYPSYEAYKEHQKEKLEKIKDDWLPDYDEKFHAALLERLQAGPAAAKGQVVLCLAARIGTEVRAFLDLGAFAVGLDLNPGKENPYVLYGDFHQIQFPEESVDVVFSNSLDHAMDLSKLAAEVRRIVKPGGGLILEIGAGSDEGSDPRHYEATYWNQVNDVVALFEKNGFEADQRHPIEYPWVGEHVRFSRER